MPACQSHGIQPPNLSISETVDEVIVHHANRLHVRIDDGRTNEAESPMFEVLAKRVRFTGGSRNLSHCLPPVLFGSSIDEPPAISVKTSELFLNCEKRPRVTYRSFDFHPVSNDRRIQCELLDPVLGVPRHFLGIEFAEDAAIPLPFFEHDRPTEPSLRRFEHKELKVFSVIVNWHAPLTIVILDHKRIVHADPGTSFSSHDSEDVAYGWCREGGLFPTPHVFSSTYKSQRVKRVARMHHLRAYHSLLVLQFRAIRTDLNFVMPGHL